MVASVLVALVMLGGCSSTKDGEDIYEDDASMRETDMGGQAHGSSLDQFRRGTLGSERGPLDDVHFDYDSAELSPEARQALESNSEWLRANPSARIEIEGHCDSRGTAEYNLGLGARRAAAVRDYLASLGIPADRMTTISYGKELQLCQDETPACWADNRRAHFAVLS
jgi:peptidoglycan-associated lipoprotein